MCTARKVQEDIEVSWDSFGISALSLEVSHAALLSSLSRLLSRRKTKAIIFTRCLSIVLVFSCICTFGLCQVQKWVFFTPKNGNILQDLTFIQKQNNS